MFKLLSFVHQCILLLPSRSLLVLRFSSLLRYAICNQNFALGTSAFTCKVSASPQNPPKQI